MGADHDGASIGGGPAGARRDGGHWLAGCGWGPTAGAARRFVERGCRPGAGAVRAGGAAFRGNPFCLLRPVCKGIRQSRGNGLHGELPPLRTPDSDPYWTRGNQPPFFYCLLSQNGLSRTIRPLRWARIVFQAVLDGARDTHSGRRDVRPRRFVPPSWTAEVDHGF